MREIIVATDDQRIVDALARFDTRCVLTSPSHASGTDRCAEVAAGLSDEIVVNVQGDEPEIEPSTIDNLIERLELRTGGSDGGSDGDLESAGGGGATFGGAGVKPGGGGGTAGSGAGVAGRGGIAGQGGWACDLVTAACAFAPGQDPADPNLVKVVCGIDGRAIYFSRSVIPFDRDGRLDAQRQPRGATTETATAVLTATATRMPAAKTALAPTGRPDGGPDRPPAYLLHLGVYAYRRAFLLEFAGWSPTPLEQMERLEQLRALEHGRSIDVLKVQRATHGIDTPEQYEAFVTRSGGSGGRGDQSCGG